MKKNPNDLSPPSTSEVSALTHEEHETRAMLMGLRYHHGNGDPFYYKPDDGGMPHVLSMIDANTLEPMVVKDESVMPRVLAAGRRAFIVFAEEVERNKP